MRRRWTKHRERTTSPVLWATGITVAVGATALLITMIPSARRYLRMRAM
ncbi:MAG TPA: hypothetical protein VFK85_03580 [Anaeromyxobacteraceae bacterium]|nr:hypothetical protein [Anaeromyxobacteraceae bacterium]